MSEFGKSPAFPQPVVYDHSRDQVNAACQYGTEPGMNMQQHVWLSLFCAAISNGETTALRGKIYADEAMPLVLVRLKDLA